MKQNMRQKAAIGMLLVGSLATPGAPFAQQRQQSQPRLPLAEQAAKQEPAMNGSRVASPQAKNPEKEEAIREIEEAEKAGQISGPKSTLRKALDWALPIAVPVLVGILAHFYRKKQREKASPGP